MTISLDILNSPEYWIIDPLLAKVTILTLDEGWYEPVEFAGSELMQSPMFPDLQLSCDRRCFPIYN
jgi:Uma2 family endonuclease